MRWCIAAILLTACAHNPGVDLSYTSTPVNNVPTTIQPGGPEIDYVGEADIHWEGTLPFGLPPLLFQMHPYALGNGQSPDSAGLKAAVGMRIGQVTVSAGHHSRHNLDRPVPGYNPDGNSHPYNINWFRATWQLGHRRDWGLLW